MTVVDLAYSNILYMFNMIRQQIDSFLHHWGAEGDGMMCKLVEVTGNQLYTELTGGVWECNLIYAYEKQREQE